MELPKNITQVGEPGQDLRIYIEDYVVSYMKQLGTRAGEKKVAIALYGKCSREKEPIYYFIYGGHEVSSITDEIKHLSSAQLQETERLRKVHFPNLQFVGYCLVNGEYFEDIMVWEQGICHLVTGYAQFYEKNDAMLEILLSVNPTEGSREVIDDSKYEAVRKRNRDRKEELIATEERSMEETGGGYRFAQFCTVAVFACVCIGGTFLMTKASGIDWKDTVSKVMVELLAQGEKAVEQSEEEPWVTAANQEVEGTTLSKEQGVVEDSISQKVTEVGSIVTEDALAQVLLEENQRGAGEIISDEEEEPQVEDGVPTLGGELLPEGQNPVAVGEQSVPNVEEQLTTGMEEQRTTDMEEQPNMGMKEQPTAGAEEPTSIETVAQPMAPRAYEVKKGDTLLGISVREYGTPAYVSEICQLNDIQNPDNIQLGQKILLP